MPAALPHSLRGDELCSSCLLVVIPGCWGICVIPASLPQPPVRHLDRCGPPLGPLPPQLCVLCCSDFSREKLGSGCHSHHWAPAKHSPSLSPGGDCVHLHVCEPTAHGRRTFATHTQTLNPTPSCHSSYWLAWGCSLTPHPWVSRGGSKKMVFQSSATGLVFRALIRNSAGPHCVIMHSLSLSSPRVHRYPVPPS